MKTILETRAAVDACIVAVAKTLKEASDTGNKKAYKAMVAALVPLGDLGVSVDELAQELEEQS